MSVSLYRPYGAYPAGSIVSLPASTEAAIIAQNIGSATANTPTPGSMTSNEVSGRAAIAAGSPALTITNPNVTANSKVIASINIGTDDGTLTYIKRIQVQAGSFLIVGNANATGNVPIDWAIVSDGLTPNQ